MSSGGFVAVLVIDLHFAEARSLKHKRKELASIKALMQRRLGAAVAEIDHQDRWQRATLTAALTGASPGAVGALADRVERFLEARHPEGVRVERIVASVEELRG